MKEEPSSSPPPNKILYSIVAGRWVYQSPTTGKSFDSFLKQSLVFSIVKTTFKGVDLTEKLFGNVPSTL